jgi:hypothetical protein
MAFIHKKSFIYEHIPPCKWIKITLSFKFQAQILRLCTSNRLQALSTSKLHPPWLNQINIFHILKAKTITLIKLHEAKLQN